MKFTKEAMAEKELVGVLDKHIQNNLESIAEKGYIELSAYLTSIYKIAKKAVVANTDNTYKDTLFDFNNIEEKIMHLKNQCIKGSINKKELADLMLALLRLTLLGPIEISELLLTKGMLSVCVERAKLDEEELDKLHEDEIKLANEFKDMQRFTDINFVDSLRIHYHTVLIIAVLFREERQGNVLAVSSDFTNILESLRDEFGTNEYNEMNFKPLLDYYPPSLSALILKDEEIYRIAQKELSNSSTAHNQSKKQPTSNTSTKPKQDVQEPTKTDKANLKGDETIQSENETRKAICDLKINIQEILHELQVKVDNNFIPVIEELLEITEDLTGEEIYRKGISTLSGYHFVAYKIYEIKNTFENYGLKRKGIEQIIYTLLEILILNTRLAGQSSMAGKRLKYLYDRLSRSKAHYDKLMCVINKFNKERKCIAKNTTAEFATEIEIYYHFAILVSLALGKDIEKESIATATDLLNILVKVREDYELSDYNYGNLKEFFSYAEKVLAKEYNENLNRDIDRFWKKKELEYYEEPDTNPGTQKREQPNKSQVHLEICKELNDIYTAKNHDYGDSFADTFKTLGPVSAVTRITDKCNRLQSLVTKSKDNQKVNESIEDTLMDLANYAIMTLMELKSLK